MKIFDSTLTHLERALDVRLVRQNVLAANLANVDTPGFSPKEVDFKAAMESAAGEGRGPSGTIAPTLGASGSSTSAVFTTDPHHMNGAGATVGGDTVPVTNATGDSPTMDGNRVDLDRTMVALAENGIAYGANAHAASKKLAILKYVAADGNA